ncbi:hypothetical protein JJQ72_16720 [Paenibacillus sp. F411]|uniref:hypothetical protein n=1 Tax=Paenibacillus sp. F411 TaxID=2820239 RepID=UPI001AAFEB07|nr:hypothetical protein [Paenibacillus sp. F411]MBO2945624.1 hypothetical protein [Paenibacillus sp. F411]
MKNEVNEMVKKIQETNAEVQGLQRQIDIMGQKKLNQIVQIASDNLEFEEIYHTSFLHDEDAEQEGEPFLDQKGNVLRGIKVIVMIEDSSDGDSEEEWEHHKEVFLIEDGTFRTFDTIYRTFECPDCDVMHKSILREMAEEDYDSEYRSELIISNIAWRLHDRAEELEMRRSRLAERVEKLNMLMAS